MSKVKQPNISKFYRGIRTISLTSVLIYGQFWFRVNCLHSFDGFHCYSKSPTQPTAATSYFHSTQHEPQSQHQTLQRQFHGLENPNPRLYQRPRLKWFSWRLVKAFCSNNPESTIDVGALQLLSIPNFLRGVKGIKWSSVSSSPHLPNHMLFTPLVVLHPRLYGPPWSPCLLLKLVLELCKSTSN